jgi:hypothetical protein
MRNTILSPAFVSLLVVTVSLTVALRLYRGNPTGNQPARSNDSALFTVLQAHNGHSHQDWLRFTQQGTLMYYTEISAGSRQVWESRLTLSSDHSFVRYDKAILNRNQRIRFDGNTLVSSAFEAETQLEVKTLDGVEAASIKFQIATCGPLPVLKRLSDPRTQVVHDGETANGNRFQVNTVNGSWYFYTNPNHLIERLEIGDINITYEDYRAVDGLILPFFQRVKKGDRLLYEIKFDTFDLNPVFAAGFFTR